MSRTQQRCVADAVVFDAGAGEWRAHWSLDTKAIGGRFLFVSCDRSGLEEHGDLMMCLKPVFIPIHPRMAGREADGEVRCNDL